jgi:hypothetical protein
MATKALIKKMIEKYSTKQYVNKTRESKVNRAMRSIAKKWKLKKG